ncbi:MAG TPA: iron-containing alcohol dehydrogenase, partial [Nannocystaceae bacterium]|nr:iron-containing alcohol dehydrogenase [Nannocystaceae bacterium]
MADGIALEGMRLIHENLRTAFTNGSDPVARTHMLMASAMGATAFQKGLGLVHALSHPLGGATGLHHGTANAIFLPYVMVHNRAHIEDEMTRLTGYLGLANPGFATALQWMLDLRRDLGLPHTLAETNGVDEALLKRLVPLAAADPSMGGNPKPLTNAEIESVFLEALHGDLG